ncbi:sulfur carrier protein ThiS [bacterium]|nr:sulfur carrier protein ThiS [bacterium]
MPQIVLNGEKREVRAQSISELLVECNLVNKRVAIELNHNVVPKDQHSSTKISHGDRVEVVQFVGGG